jgi:hypothetical protein
MLLTLSQVVVDPATAVTTYDSIRWSRSITGANGVYEEISAYTAQPAVLTGMFREPHALNGKTMLFKVNGATVVSVTFSGSDPYSTASVITDINGATGLVVASADSLSQLVLTTVLTGTAASIEILESEGALALGFQTGDFAIGKGVDNTLGSTQHEYFFTDSNASKEYWYKTQLRHHTTMAVAPQSVPIPGSEVPVIAYDLLISAYVKVIDMRGRPIEGRNIVIANVFLPNTVGAYNIFRHYEDVATDETGYAVIRLLRGATIDVHVEGTNFTRRVKLPLAGDPVDLINLFDPVLSDEDEFGIQQPDINFAIRLS